MKRFSFLFLSLLYTISIQAQDFDTKKMRYIEQYKYWAMDEQIRTGVPASISLAQGILETGAGTSELCTEANNHFGIKCKKEWTGETYLHDDDRRRECFRKYKSAKDSYVDHSNFLKERAHYASLFSLDVTDYQAWAKGLRKAGYATNPKYAVRLIQLIEKYNLQEYSYEAIELSKEKVIASAEVVPEQDAVIKVEEKKPIKEVEVVQMAPRTTTMRPKRKIVYDKLMVKNGRNGFWAHKGDYLLPEAVQYNIRYAKLLAINDLDDAPLYDDMFIYLKRKAKKGTRSSHVVKEGESLHSISQETGVQLKYLAIYNNLYDNEEPAVGEKIYLQSRSSRTPKLRGSTPAVATKKELVNQTTIVKKKVEPSAVTIVKNDEVEKIDFSEPAKSVPAVKKKDAILGIKKDLKTETKARTIPKKVTATKVVERPKTIQKPKTDVKVTEMKPAAKISNLVVEKTENPNSPIINFQKAKKVESLMGDGNKEIEKLWMKNQQELKKQKVIAAPQGTPKNVLKEKKIKTESKKKKTTNYNQKNVSEDVKDLKKKFDTLIYDED